MNAAEGRPLWVPVPRRAVAPDALVHPDRYGPGDEVRPLGNQGTKLLRVSANDVTYLAVSAPGGRIRAR